ncbi:MAG: hypothetical protein K5866_07950 [Treponema sp.]|nr:hypothetical protein [Treponema sp.]
MTSNNIVTNQLSAPNIQANVKNLSEGESVRVKVISNLGNGKYQGIVSGVRVSFTSQKPLKSGTSFLAKVTGQNGKIILIPQNQTKESANGNNIKILDSNESLLKLINQFSLPQDNLSLHLLKQFIQLKMPLDIQKINKFYNLALKFKGKEKRLAEALALLKEKGLELEENQILEFLEIWENDFENQEEEKKEILNKFNSKKGSWYIFPFEIVDCREDKVFGKGNIKLFINQSQVLDKLNLLCCYKDNRFFFNLSFKNKKLSTIAYNLNNFSEDESKALEFALNQKFRDKNINIFWQPYEEISGTSCQDENFTAVKGEV